MDKFNKLYKTIMESVITQAWRRPSPIPHFSNIAVNNIYRNWTKSKWIVQLNGQEGYIKPSIKKQGNSVYYMVSYDFHDKNNPNKGQYENQQQIFVSGDGITLHSLHLMNYNTLEYNSYIIEANYDETKNISRITWQLDGSRVSPFFYLRGRITMEIPSNIVNPTTDATKLDLKQFNQFAKKKIHEKVRDEVVKILDIQTELIEGKQVRVNVKLDRYENKAFDYEWLYAEEGRDWVPRRSWAIEDGANLGPGSWTGKKIHSQPWWPEREFGRECFDICTAIIWNMDRACDETVRPKYVTIRIFADKKPGEHIEPWSLRPVPENTLIDKV